MVQVMLVKAGEIVKLEEFSGAYNMRFVTIPGLLIQQIDLHTHVAFCKAEATSNDTRSFPVQTQQ